MYGTDLSLLFRASGIADIPNLATSLAITTRGCSIHPFGRRDNASITLDLRSATNASNLSNSGAPCAFRTSVNILSASFDAGIPLDLYTIGVSDLNRLGHCYRRYATYSHKQ
jgi:hypothetical protein